jgi:hypothetical protein
MPKKVKRARKHFQVDPAKVKLAPRAIGAKTQTETIERALDLVIEDHANDRIVRLEGNSSGQLEAFRRTEHHHRNSYRELAKGK